VILLKCYTIVVVPINLSVLSVPTRAGRLGILIARSPERHDSVDGQRAEGQLRGRWFDIVVGVATSRARERRVGKSRHPPFGKRRHAPALTLERRPAGFRSACCVAVAAEDQALGNRCPSKSNSAPTNLPVAVSDGPEGPAAAHFRIFRIGSEAGRSRAAASYLWTILSGFQGRARRQVRGPRANRRITSWTYRHPSLAVNRGSGNRRPRFRVSTDRKSSSGGAKRAG